MRVAFDAACFAQSRAGTARVAARLLEAVQVRGADVVELGRAPHARRGSLRQKLGAARVDLDWYGRGLVAAARAARADVLHCPTFRGPLRRAGLPVVVTVHDLAVLRQPSWFPLWSRTYGRLALPRVTAVADRIVCISEQTAEDVRDLLAVAPERIRIVPNGIDRLFAEPAGERPLAAPYLLAVATPEPRKNLLRLLEAYHVLRSRGRAEQLVLVGADGWGGVPLPASDGVVRLGRVDDTRLRDLYAHAAATVYPSLWEGFGLVPGEALAAGCRLVCSNLSPLHDVAGDDATYCDPEDPADIARAVEEALAGAAPAPRLAFTWEAAAEQTMAVWQELVA